jgi:hypothetical protein
VLVTALALAILYFALMELLLVDASRAQAEAQRFRARTMAATLAESGAELAALNMLSKSGSSVVYQDSQGTIKGQYSRSNDTFTLEGQATAIGAMRQDATVSVQGRIDPATNTIKIDYTMHGQ